MMRFLPKLEATLMFGVGAAFDFHTGRIKDSPAWVKRAGLQWFHRVIQDPRRLWRRYLRNNSSFLWHISMQLLGLKKYPSTEALGKSIKAQESLVRKAADTVSLEG
jgi:N-acetylglucosaminyldiphosphoundecaprenol N-acetyl-beta-D-mannosaminyltransferase